MSLPALGLRLGLPLYHTIRSSEHCKLIKTPRPSLLIVGRGKPRLNCPKTLVVGAQFWQEQHIFFEMNSMCGSSSWVHHYSPFASSYGFLMWIILDRILLLFFLVDQFLSLSASVSSCQPSSKIKSASKASLWVARVTNTGNKTVYQRSKKVKVMKLL